MKEGLLEILNDSYERDELSDSRLDYLGDTLFEFITYEDEYSELFATKALEVWDAISSKTTFDFIDDPENRKWFLLMCNMPFFAKRINWGSSVRAAFWDLSPSVDRPAVFWELPKDTFNTEESWEELRLAVHAFITPQLLTPPE